jgi:D-glycero-alpha-D-manno-heptose-7-phosphate kinase
MAQLIISQTPYRISLGGGGTDLPFYSNERGGRLITASINQYIKVSVSKRPLDKKILIQTTNVQFAQNLDELKNDIIRETLRYYNLKDSIQIATFSTLPSGIGLGSSSTVIVGLINSISRIINHTYSSLEIAKIAFHIEREILQFAGGSQDQYIAALGGIQVMDINKNGEVVCTPLLIEEGNRNLLQKHLVLIYTGRERSSSEIIKSQKIDMIKAFEVYDEIKEIGHKSIELLTNADIEGLGNAMDRHWAIKKTLSKQITTNNIDKLYIKLKKLGSPGGKIIGAGGGGFFMMAVPDNVSNYINKIKDFGFFILDWKFEFNGSRIIEDVI